MKLTFFQRHAYNIGCTFAACLWPFFPSRRRLAIDNILRAKVAQNKKDARIIAKKSWCHLAGHIAESLCVPNIVTRENWREHLDLTKASPEAVRLLLDSPNEPILLVSSHHGVWEAATNILSFARPMIAIARVMNSKIVAKWMKNHFRGNITVIDKNKGFSREIINQWKNTNAAMTILIDQHTRGGLKLSFFGRPAMTFTSATRMAMRTGARIVVGSFVRVSPYYYRLIGDEPIQLSKDSSLEEATQLLNDRLEKAIRACPEQYLWVHKRWRVG